jgi:hypothetical protein
MMAKEEKGTEWMQTLWRPAMGWLYMLVCFCDMIVFPVLWALWQGVNHVPITQWNPLSLQGAGLFHIAMGAVLGIAAFGRTQEKLAGTAANPTATSQTITNNQNMSGNVAGGFGSNQGGGFGGTPSFGGTNNGGFNSSSGGAPAFGAPTSGGFGSAPLGGNTASSFGGSGFGATAPSMAPAPSTSFTPPASWGTTPVSSTPSVNSKGQKVIPQDPDPVL